jgi:hypothetical protein
MFITSTNSGYHGTEQFCSGLFLILMQPKPSDKYPMMSDVCSDCGKTRTEHDAPLSPEVQKLSDKMHRIWKLLFTERTKDNPYLENVKDACEIILNAKHTVEGCRYFRPSSVLYPLRAVVRHVAMKQVGHFMMGYARIKGVTVTLSGSYGGDGLPTSVSDKVYESGVELPQYLYDAWAKGNGWNNAGDEAPLMREWALENLKALRQ